MNTTNFTIVNSSGRVLRTGEGASESVSSQHLEEGERIIFGVSHQVGSMLVGGDVVCLTEATPMGHYKFDETNSKWVADIASLVSARCKEVDIACERRSLSPIVCDGIRIDGDDASQKNIANKLSGVKERLRLGVGMAAELMLWIGYDNHSYTWDNLQSYCDWLSGCVIAFEDRGTRLRLAARNHKANIDAMTTVEEVLSYDIMQGWPDDKPT